MEKVAIVAYGRSAVGKAFKGSLAQQHPIEFGAEVLKGVVNRVPELNPEDIDDVIVGSSASDGKAGMNIGRNLVIRAGLPETVPGQTVNRFCSSGLQTIAMGAAMINAGFHDVVVAGGVESMSNPSISNDSQYFNEWLEKNTDMYISMGDTAENVAESYNVTREDMDKMAVESNEKAAEAVESGAFDKEIIPVHGINADGEEVILERDESYRKGTTMETLAGLRTVFKEDGSVTAGQSSQMSDGAGFVVLMSEKKAQEIGAKPIAYFKGFSLAGVDPAVMGIGPIEAVNKVLNQTELTFDDIDVIEFNEAFASQAIATMRETGMPKEKVNPRGGAIALGHPLGATGGILTAKAISYLQDTGGKYGLVTMCVGGGMGAAGIIEMAE